MCLTLPAKVVKVNGDEAEILAAGKKQKVRLGSAEKIRKGDWVLYTSDFLIKKISHDEAREILDLLGSSKKVNPDELDGKFKNILAAAAERDLVKAEIEYLLNLGDFESFNRASEGLVALYSEANVVRKANLKDHICIHGLIEFSNYCQNNCLYCGLRQDNENVKRYRLSVRQIINAAVKAVAAKGYKILVLQSGEDDYYDREKLVKIVAGIKEKCRAFIYLSIGDRPREVYRKLKTAGANGVLYRFETANPEIYQALHPGDSLEARLSNLEMMRDLGYTISTGMLVGLPGQTRGDLAEDILLMKKLGTFMPSFGPLIPSKDTPLFGEKKVDPELMLKIIAVTRLVMPRSRIPVTTAMETLGGEEFRPRAFWAGANSVMFNLTPEKHRQNYAIYENKFFDREKKYERWGLFKGELSYRMLEEEFKVRI